MEWNYNELDMKGALKFNCRPDLEHHHDDLSPQSPSRNIKT